jgi:hypothetical protein
VEAQYFALDPEQQKRARRTGRRRIRKHGSLKKAAAAMLDKPSVQEARRPGSLVVLTRAQAQADALKYYSRRWSVLTPPCPSCRTGSGLPKRCWPTREWADEIRDKQNARDSLCVYQCPAQQGYWHVGLHNEQAKKSQELLPGIVCAADVCEEGTIQSQIRDEQLTVTEQKGELLTDKTEALESLNETTEFDDWEYYDDDYELAFDGDCNESQPCRGDEYYGDDDFDPASPPTRIEVLRRWWYSAKWTVGSYLLYHFPWLDRPNQVSTVVEEDFEIPF